MYCQILTKLINFLVLNLYALILMNVIIKSLNIPSILFIVLLSQNCLFSYLICHKYNHIDFLISYIPSLIFSHMASIQRNQNTKLYLGIWLDFILIL